MAGLTAFGQTALAGAIHSRSCARWGEATPTALVGQHPAFVAALERLARFARSDSPVLITGETGTGKELFARALYLLSRRDGQAFQRVNCAQYQETQLAASELFGHRKGSFTGAAADHVGLFESAHHGVIFLDEVAELSLTSQAMLLRVLSESEIVPVGDTRPRRVDVRVVAATSADLHALVQAGSFRRDLYFRLRALHVRVPPLRERGDDWELIREYYLHALSLSSDQRKRFSRAALDVLASHDWPGNVREVKALVDTGFHLADGELIEPCHFLEALEEMARLDQLRAVPLVDVATQCWERMTTGGATFWEVVHAPYLARELSRAQVRELVARGLDTTRGSFKRTARLFGLPDGDYMRFMAFLRHHSLKPDRD